MNAVSRGRLISPDERHMTTFGLVLTLAVLAMLLPTQARAQTSPITSSGLNTQVGAPSTLPSGQIQYIITGGTRPGNGTNLFHSFGTFGVPGNNIANFLNETALPTSNILGRVTGGNPSNIFGTIQTTGFESANLFLMNPAGIVFGPKASLNVGGSVAFTTANNIRLTNAGIFHADLTSPSVLTSAPVEAFGFLGSNSGAITVQGSNLSVEPEYAIHLVGGDITIAPDGLPPGTMQPAQLTALGGQINLVSVASAGEIPVSSFEPVSGMTLGSISLGPGTLIDVTGDAAGTVRIRGGTLVLDNTTITADTGDANGAAIAIDVKVAGDLTIMSNSAPAFAARATGMGNAGDIQIASESLTTTSLPDGSLFSTIESYTNSDGAAGNVRITTGGLNVSTDAFSPPVLFIDSGTGGAGSGGHVAITAADLHFSNTGIVTGDSILGGSGAAGNISIKSGTLMVEGTTLAADSVSARGGNVSLEASDITITNNSFIDVLSLEGGSTITITADRLTVSNASSILNQTALGAGGGITITAKEVELKNESLVLSQTFGDGNAGSIRVTATDHITIADDPLLGSNPSGFYTNSLGNAGLGNLGNAGSIDIVTGTLTMTGGARINSTTQSTGRGGDVTIVAQDINLSGQRAFEVDSELFGLGGTKASGIYTRTVGSELCSGACGEAGHVSITTGSLTMSDGGAIDSGTTNPGRGGNVSVHATDTIALSGTMLDGTPSGIFSRTIGTDTDAGSGGNIALTASQSVSISDGAAVSASSTGPGNAGNIAINAGQQFEMRNSSVRTEAAQASGGNIDVQAIDRIRLVNSSISTSVLGGAGSGGNITLDPNVVILQNSQILARAVQGAGGNITITTPLYLPDSTSTVSASSQFGLNGTVNIQSPTSNLAGTISSLPASLRQVQSLQTGRCAALADSRSSSLIVAGRDILPAEPGGWSPSPFALIMEQTDPMALSSPPVAAMIASADAPVSLRRLTPAGFLTQRFAENGLTGCRA